MSSDALEKIIPNWFLRVATNHYFQLVFHLIGFVTFLVLMYPSIAIDSWRESVPYLVFLSVYANIVGHMGGFTGAAAGIEAQRNE